MGQLGLGVMIGLLGGNEESVSAWRNAVGKKISALALKDDALHFRFVDGTTLTLADEGQSCCEHRYMVTDDDLAHFIGARLRNAEVRSAPPVEDKYGEHEVAFLVVKTSKGSFTMATHNEHNGYYGGFLIRASQ